MNIAQIILSQIKTIDPRAMWAWGAKDLVNTGKGLQFRVGGMAKFKGIVNIVYNEGDDLYDIDFMKVRKGEIKVVQNKRGVFVDQLVNTIDLVVQ